MLNFRIVCVGTLKESYLREAIAEYEKRLSAFCSFSIVELKEYKLPDSPSPAEIEKALDEEADRILKAVLPRSYQIALCVEGKQFSSEKLAARLEEIEQSFGAITLIIGSSHGLSSKVKAASDLRLSISELTFPHQLVRVMLMEIFYRCFNIIKGTKYHK
ncbi:MAG: 23S rRNA (pseudouridine(1915)-N(3))-methyltransferase RlmH [Clostridia bacterium]|nr:23S rRNA (pseudouridine(1915)-N(3))-methyltransferase RlmH [Clostridia bacterium]